mmetsp:Transcript_4092/g.5523  ORF Transcript_4092/g.5523 Transcript_4092/m.5523 type:complete len:228 (+) Transcript_4092:494-1177(+)
MIHSGLSEVISPFTALERPTGSRNSVLSNVSVASKFSFASSPLYALLKNSSSWRTTALLTFVKRSLSILLLLLLLLLLLFFVVVVTAADEEDSSTLSPRCFFSEFSIISSSACLSRAIWPGSICVFARRFSQAASACSSASKADVSYSRSSTDPIPERSNGCNKAFSPSDSRNSGKGSTCSSSSSKDSCSSSKDSSSPFVSTKTDFLPSSGAHPLNFASNVSFSTIP